MDIEIPVVDDFDHVRNGKVVIDEDKCTGCGMCADICPGDVREMVGKKGEKKACVRTKLIAWCMACNACQAACPADAIGAVSGYDYGGYYKQMDRSAEKLVPPRNF